jgi:dihydrofolate reductase
MEINLIAAIDTNGLIGLNGSIPWHCPEDLKRFKALTTGHTVIMGRKTWDSLPVKPLSNRRNIIVSANKDWYADHVGTMDNIQDAYSLDDALRGNGKFFVIGGQRLYEEAIHLADRVYLTRIKATIKPNETAAYFPVDALKDFEMVREEKHPAFTFQEWVRL